VKLSKIKKGTQAVGSKLQPASFHIETTGQTLHMASALVYKQQGGGVQRTVPIRPSPALISCKTSIHGVWAELVGS